MSAADDFRAQTHSPYHDLMGIEVVSWEDGLARLHCLLRPQHANRNGIGHGGVMLSLIDQAGAFAGLFCPHPGRKRSAVTLDLDCRFTGQGRIGALLVAEGRVATAGRNVFFAKTEVKDETGALIAFGASTHRYREGSGDPMGVPIAPRHGRA